MAPLYVESLTVTPSVTSCRNLRHIALAGSVESMGYTRHGDCMYDDMPGTLRHGVFFNN
jgi:hypothetical protein